MGILVISTIILTIFSFLKIIGFIIKNENIINIFDNSHDLGKQTNLSNKEKSDFIKYLILFALMILSFTFCFPFINQMIKNMW